MAVINTNVSSLIAQNAMTKNERSMSGAMEQLSTGKRINSAADDAAGLAISSRMTSQIRGLDQAGRNAGDAISMIQTADGALNEVSNMLQRMRELAVQSSSGTVSTTDQDALGTEFDQLAAEIERIADSTQFNGNNLLDGSIGTAGAVTFQVGPNASQTVSVTFANFETANADSATGPLGDIDIDGDGDLTDSAAGLASLDISSAGDTTAALHGITSALDNLNSQRATLGAAMNRLEYTADNLANESANTQAARSRILDADYATATTELARTQIIQQAGTAMLAQANQLPQTVLSLLQ